jgi:hypothetical protein
VAAFTRLDEAALGFGPQFTPAPPARALTEEAEVMRGQLARLLKISERPGVLVHVVPSEFGANAGLGGPVSVATVADKPDVLLTSSLLEDVVTSDASQARTASTTFEVVRGVAANIMDSRRIIVEAITTWENRQATGASPVTAETAGSSA